jgi:hypothetical protein
MSDQPLQEPQYECALCGINGGFGTICPNCQKPIEQPRQYTLSEVRSGRAPSQTKDRPSGAAPLIVQVPGSAPIGQ